VHHSLSCVFRARGGGWGTKLDRKGVMSIFRGSPGLRDGNLESQITELSDCFGTKKFIQHTVDKEQY
jgi:hypothetical protein